jgi:hypothetical protein
VNQVTKKKSTELSVIDFEADASEFSAELTSDDFALPFLNIIQNTSQQKKAGGGQIGDIFNTVTGEIYSGKDSLTVVPCFYERVYIEWADRDKGVGKPVNIYPLSWDVNSNTSLGGDGKTRFINDNSGNYVEDTAQHYVMVVLGENTYPALVAMKSSNLTTSRQWNTMKQGNTAKNKNGQVYIKPDFSKMYKLSAAEITKGNYTWYVWKVQPGPDLSEKDMNLYKTCRDFAKAAKAGAVNIEHGEDNSKTSSVDLEEAPF